MTRAAGTMAGWFPVLMAVSSVALARDQIVDISAIHTSKDAAHFGEYSDLDEDGVRLVGAVDLAGSPSWSSGDSSYWTVRARDLGLDTYQAVFSLGTQGRYDLTLTFDGLRQFKRDDGRTPYFGDETLVLPDSWVAGPTTGDLTQLGAIAREFDQDRERDLVRLDGSYHFTERWSVAASFQHEEVEGTQVEGGAIYADLDTAFAALLPSPIDFETQDINASVAYAGERFNSVLSYLHTDFDNELLTWQNAYSSVGGAAVDYPNGLGGLSLAPDWERNQVRTTGSYLPSFLEGLSLQWDAAWDAVEQDQAFSPYTVNPALAVAQPLPATDLDGEVETISVDVRATYRPRWKALRKLTLRGGYHYDDRDYDRTRNAYRYVRGDSADQPDTALAIFANAHDNQREGLELAGDYRLPWWRAKLTFRYDYVETERRNAAVEETESDIYTTALRLTPLTGVSVRAEYSFEDRKADTYFFDQSFFARRTTEFINAIPDDQRFDNHPLLSQYHLANAEVDAAKLDISYSGLEQWYFGANFTYEDVGYDKSVFGLTDAENWFWNADLMWLPGKALSISGYLSFGENQTALGGRSFAGGAEKVANRTFAPVPQGSDPRRDWFVDTQDEVWTAGVSADWAFSERLGFEFRYVYMDTQAEHDFANGGASDLDTVAVPKIETTLHSISLTADYAWRDDLSLRVMYQYYDYEEDDWALDDVLIDTVDNVLTLGAQPDDEEVNMVAVAVRYQF